MEFPVPGKPAKSGHQASHRQDRVQPAPDLEAARTALQQWEANPRAARSWLRGATREDLIEILEGLDKGLRPADQTPASAALGAEVREVLRKRKVEKRPRDFIRFFYSHRIAGELGLPEILRDPEVYAKHPEPDVGAAIMVVHRFAPQIAKDLMNYKDWSLHPTTMMELPADKCPCHSQVLPGTELLDGHVLSTDPAKLASPYLRDILAKGKKYRLQQPVSSVLTRLREGLTEYVVHKAKAHQGDMAYIAALEAWAALVVAKAEVKLAEASRCRPPEPDGFPGLRQQLRAAKNALVFGPEDRAPHAIFFACGRLYQARLRQRLEEVGAFRPESRSKVEVLNEILAYNEELGVRHHNRLPYLYGSWKAKKEGFPMEYRHLPPAR